MMAELYDIQSHTVTYHLQKISSDSKLDEDSVTRRFRVTANDGKNYLTEPETTQLQRLVSAYLTLAKDMANR